MNENLIVTVNISKTTRVVSQESFNIACIFGPSARIALPTEYTAASQMLQANGGPFLPADPEYIEANAFMSQNGPKPPSFFVAPNTAAVEQEDTLAVGVLAVAHMYKFTLNSVVIQYTSIGGDTQQSILAALLVAIGVAFPVNPPLTGAVTGAGAGALLTLTATTAGSGNSFTSVDADLTYLNVIANHSISQDIATAQANMPANTNFYGVIVTSHAASDILQVATYVESELLVYVTATLDGGCLTNVTTDIMSILKGEAFDRTMIMFSAQANTNGPDGAWMGYMISTTPGIGNWAMKTLTGVTPDPNSVMTPTAIANVLGKNGNVYINIAGAGCTLYGKASGGEYFDVTIFLDWLASTIQTGIIAVETDPLNLKIAYTNGGITQIETPVSSALRQGQTNQGIVPGWDVFAPNANDLTPAQRATRILNEIGFDAQLAGAINQINLQGYVTS
jgi:hypothetical protein